MKLSLEEKRALYRLTPEEYTKFLWWKRSFDFGQCAIVRALLRTKVFHSEKRKAANDRIRAWLATANNDSPLSPDDYQEFGVDIINRKAKTLERR